MTTLVKDEAVDRDPRVVGGLSRRVGDRPLKRVATPGTAGWPSATAVRLTESPVTTAGGVMVMIASGVRSMMICTVLS